MLSAAVAALLSGRALADTDITTKVTDPQNTAADGNITIESSGAVVITTSPPTAAAVTINSDSIVNNLGLISYKDVTDAIGVEAITGHMGEFEGTGKIDLTGMGSSKTAILSSGPSGNLNSCIFTGVIPSGGTTPIAINLQTGSTLAIQRDQSIGINQLSGTTIIGDIDIAGSLTVVPTSSTSTSLGHVIAIYLAGKLTGNLDIQTGGIIQATGESAQGIQILDTLTGSVINNGTIQTAGTLRASPANPNEPQAGSALAISGSITGGIYNAGPSTISDTTTVRGTISTGGNAPTILIAPPPQPTTGIEIGIYDDSVDSGYSFLNRGNIVGTSINPDVNVTTFSIIGASADLQTVFDGGIFNGGAISAAATTNTKAASVTATALYIGDNTVI